MFPFYFSLQQCPGGYEDPTTQPDGINCELGTTPDRLPPTHHQLHGLLQLVEKRRRRRKDVQQDRGPEDGESAASYTSPTFIGVCSASDTSSTLRERRWDQCAVEVTCCDEHVT